MCDCQGDFDFDFVAVDLDVSDHVEIDDAYSDLGIQDVSEVFDYGFFVEQDV